MFTDRSDAELFVLGRLAHLHEGGFGDPGLPRWVYASPLAEEPHRLADEAIDGIVAGLVAAGLVDAHEAKDEGSDEPPTIEHCASDALMAAVTDLRAELRRRSPVLPDSLGALVLLHDAVRSPDGVLEEVVDKALEAPPVGLSGKDAMAVYRGLMGDRWLFFVQRPETPTEWFASPTAWSHADAIDEALTRRFPEMRERLARLVADELQLAEDAPVRKALHAVDRLHFVLPGDELRAYRNMPAPVALDADGRSATTTSSPNVCAMIAHTLELQRGDRVLVCGVKGGFTASLCAHVVGVKGRVVCLETDPAIVEHARTAIRKAGFERAVDIRLVKDVTVGLKDAGEWEAVVVNGKIPKVPRPILQQMVDGGRLLIFLQDGDDNAQTAYLIRKNGGAMEHKALTSFLFTPIHGEYGYEPVNWPEHMNLLGIDPHDVFLSYSSRDQQECDAWMQRLEQAGIRCWQSARNHPVGKDGYEGAIMDAMRAAKLFVILLSHDSVASQHVKNELTNATSMKKAILPLRLPASPRRLPSTFQYHLEGWQHFDVEEAGPDQVVAAARTLLGYGDRRSTATPTEASDVDADLADAGAEASSVDRRFALLLELVLEDGVVSAKELSLLVAEAVSAGLAARSEAVAFVRARATALAPDVRFDG